MTDIDWKGVKEAVEYVMSSGANYVRNDRWIVYLTSHSIRIDLHTNKEQ